MTRQTKNTKTAAKAKEMVADAQQRIAAQDSPAVSATPQDSEASAESTSGYLLGVPGPVLALAYGVGVAAEVVIENVQRLAH
jgi:hypothetical protein